MLGSIRRADANSEVLVVYSGIAAAIAGNGPVVHVSEKRDAIISWYAMYRDESTYPAVKEGELVSFDFKRLKR